jgi:DNA-binding HxlR family transcriptional regulator
MRKDRIEERITGIEKDMKELRSELSQELRSMVSELKEFQRLMVEDRIAEVQETTSRQYCQMAYDSALDDSRKTLLDRMNYCPPGPDRDECVDHLVEQHLRAGVEGIDKTSPDESGPALRDMLNHDEEMRKRNVGTPCEPCLKIYYAERDRMLATCQKFAGFRQSLTQARPGIYYSQLPDDLTVSEIVDPLSHRSRFVMLKNLTSGCMSFKELGEVTGHEAGHLVYHINKLTAAGLVSKEESGLYQITEKGMGVMEVIRKMHGR